MGKLTEIEYGANEKLSPLVTEICWTHNLVIFQKCKADLQRVGLRYANPTYV